MSTLTGSEFKTQLKNGSPKFGLFLNAHSPTVAEQLAHSGYDWLLVDTQHGPMGYLRIWSFMQLDVEGFLNEVIRILALLPQNGLIIDVRGNGGGVIVNGEWMLQMLTEFTRRLIEGIPGALH